MIVPGERWTDCLKYWKNLRREFAKDPSAGLPTSFEIHSLYFLSPRPLKELKREDKRQQAILNARSASAGLDSVGLARAQLELSDMSLSRAMQMASDAGHSVKEIARAARIPQQDVKNRIDGAHSPDRLASVPCLQETSGAQTLRRAMFSQCVDQLAALPEISVMNAHSADTSGRGKAKLYGRLLAGVNRFLVEQDAWGTVVVDGSPSARTLYYREAHRSLPYEERRILEDEVIRDSRESHFVQMADIAAHCAHALLKGAPEHFDKLSPVVRSLDDDPVTSEQPGFL